MLNQVEQKKSPFQNETEAEIQRIKSEEMIERIASLFTLVIKTGLLTCIILYIFNKFVV